MEFRATDHALLFAWLARSVVQRAGEVRGEAVVREAVRRYGGQRGRRMALRAQADGQPLTMANYRAYGEWQAAEGETAHEKVMQGPDMVAHVHRCPWHRAWEAHKVMPFGRLYCLEIDQALVRGFNPALQLDVNSILTEGDPYCEFVYHDVEPAGGTGKGVAMPWAYHLGHLYKTVGEVVVEELGEMGQRAVDEALAEFARHHGQEAARTVAGYGDTDFDRLPESPGD
jgi:hypothetical protein